jgi:hypothetical protein
MNHIRNEFLKIAATLQGDDYNYVAILYKGLGATPIALSVENFNSICMNPPSGEPNVLECFVPSKGSSLHFRTYRCVLSISLSLNTMLHTIDKYE